MDTGTRQHGHGVGRQERPVDPILKSVISMQLGVA